MFVNPTVPSTEGETMRRKVFAVMAAAGALGLTGAAMAAVINGTPGDDVLRGTEHADQIHAFAGNDAVYARGGADDVRAGSGNDGTRAADGNDLVYGGRGNDVIAGGNGNDRLYGGSDSDEVVGGDGNDRAAGNRGADSVSGNDGNDSLFGGWGADRVFGGSGNDELHALAPDGVPDLLNCGPGNDKAFVFRPERPRTQLVGCEKSRSSKRRPRIRTKARMQTPMQRRTGRPPNPREEGAKPQSATWHLSPLGYQSVTTLLPSSPPGAATIV